VAAAGEALRASFATCALHARLQALGFDEIEDLAPREIAARFFPQRLPLAPERGGHLIRACVKARAAERR